MGVIEKPSLAIIGCGAVVDYHVIPALRRLEWLPRVLVDPAQERLDLVAKTMGSKGTNAIKSTDWTTIADQFDAAIVAVPHAFHAQIGVELANAGKHVFMEKPLATTRAECGAMIAASHKSGVIMRVGLLRRYLHAAQWLKALIGSGNLGEIRRFDAREGGVFNWALSSDASIRRATAGGGVLIDTGAHTLDLLLWWLGDVVSLDYRDDSEGGIEADCVLECVLASGAEGTVELSRTRDMRNSVRIDGTRGFVDMHLFDNKIYAASDNVLAFRSDGIDPTNFPMQRFPDLFDAEFRDFLTCTLGQGAPGITGEEGQLSVALIERCYKARRPLVQQWRLPPASSANATAHQIQHGSTVVVTGASGFIGGRLVERLVSEYGAKVRCLVRDIGHATRLARLPVKIIKADLADPNAIDKAVDGADYVFHCAYDVRSRHQNIESVRNLIAATEKYKTRRLVQVSTFSVYEPFPSGPLSEETCDGDRSSTYVSNKLDLEQMIFDAARRGVPATIVQPAIVYGPFCKPWTNAQAEMLLWGEVILPDRGEGICNAVYIDDLVDGLLLAASHPAAIGERFIMSGPKPVTWNEFYGEFSRSLGTDPPTFWQAEKILKANSGIMRDIKLVLSNPKRIVQIIVRWNPARRALQASLDALPKKLHDLVSKHYFGSGGRKLGEVYLPDRQTLNLYTSEAVVDSGKARQLLGYDPKFDFTAGMALTRQYLEWAFGDVRQTARAQRDAANRASVAAPADLANAD